MRTLAARTLSHTSAVAGGRRGCPGWPLAQQCLTPLPTAAQAAHCLCWCVSHIHSRGNRGRASRRLARGLTQQSCIIQSCAGLCCHNQSADRGKVGALYFFKTPAGYQLDLLLKTPQQECSYDRLLPCDTKLCGEVWVKRTEVWQNKRRGNSLNERRCSKTNGGVAKQREGEFTKRTLGQTDRICVAVQVQHRSPMWDVYLKLLSLQHLSKDRHRMVGTTQAHARNVHGRRTQRREYVRSWSQRKQRQREMRKPLCSDALVPEYIGIGGGEKM